MMQWRRVDPVQTVGALIATRDEAVDALAAAMSRKSGLFQSLMIEHGDGWAAIFGARIPGEQDLLIPHLAGATSLYELAPGMWFPVGVAMAAPDHTLDALMRAIFDHYRATPPAIIVPRFGPTGDQTDEADLYLIRNPVAFHHSSLSVTGRLDVSE